jgi:hypothetical protein
MVTLLQEGQADNPDATANSLDGDGAVKGVVVTRQRGRHRITITLKRIWRSIGSSLSSTPRRSYRCNPIRLLL